MSTTAEDVSLNGLAPEAQKSAAETTESTTAPAEPSKRVYFGKLARGSTEAQVRDFITSVGDVDIVSLHEKTIPGRYAYFAFATYKSLDDAKKAIDLNGKELGGRPVIVEFAKSEEEALADREARNQKRKEVKKARDEKTKAAKADATEGETEGKEEQAESKLKKKTKAKKPRRRQPGEEDGDEGEEGVSKARIDAESEESGEKSRQARRSRKDKRLQISDEEDKNTIFVSNLPFSVDDTSLAAIFNDLSIQIKRAKVVTTTFRRGPTRKVRSKGFGFVELEDENQREEAVQKLMLRLLSLRKVPSKLRLSRLSKRKGGNTSKPLNMIEGSPIDYCYRPFRASAQL
ncbi:hypothetical protein L204_101822 [Cryptococcus depauperatus]